MRFWLVFLDTPHRDAVDSAAAGGRRSRDGRDGADGWPGARCPRRPQPASSAWPESVERFAYREMDPPLGVSGRGVCDWEDPIQSWARATGAQIIASRQSSLSAQTIRTFSLISSHGAALAIASMIRTRLAAAAEGLPL